MTTKTQRTTKGNRKLNAASAHVKDNRVLERSDNVLWTIAGDGILLHNFARRKFLELDAIGYAAWGFLDGARTVEDVVSRCSTIGNGSDAEHKVRQIVDTLVTYGFVEARRG